MKIYHSYIEHELVIKLKENDIKAFEEIYCRYKNKLKAFTRIYIKNNSQAEEVVQEVFIKLWEKRHLLDENSSFQSYLFQMVKNHVFNIFRKKVYEIHLEDIPALEHHAPNFTEDQIHYYDLKKTTQNLIDKLPKVQRNVIIMSRLEELNNDEISERLNLSKRTVEHHIYLAVKSLRKGLTSLKTSIFLVLSYLIF